MDMDLLATLEEEDEEEEEEQVLRAVAQIAAMEIMQAEGDWLG